MKRTDHSLILDRHLNLLSSNALKSFFLKELPTPSAEVPSISLECVHLPIIRKTSSLTKSVSPYRYQSLFNHFSFTPKPNRYATVTNRSFIRELSDYREYSPYLLSKSHTRTMKLPTAKLKPPTPQCGIATLEAALISVIFIPILLGLFVIAWYLYETANIRAAMSRSLNEFAPQTLRVTMGRMDGWLQSRHAVFQKEVKLLTDELRRGAEQQLGAASEGQPGYKVDLAVGYGVFKVDTASGGILHPAKRSDRETPRIVTFPDHNFLRSDYPTPEEMEQNAAMLAFSALRLLAPLDPNNEQPTPMSPFAFTSGNYGSRLQLHYGPSHVYGKGWSHFDNRAWAPVNDYLRITTVISAAIIVDFTDSALGRIVAAFPISGTDPPTPRWPLKITTVEVMSPRSDF